MMTILLFLLALLLVPDWSCARRRPWILPIVRRRLPVVVRGGSSNDGDKSPVSLLQRTNADSLGFKILDQTILHDNWRKLVSRKVELPSRRVADFEIVSQGDRGGRVTDGAVMVFVWHRSNGTATLVYEYMPAVHQFVPGLCAGMVEDKHHGNGDDNDDSNESDDSNDNNPVYTAAVHELEEECRLTGGTWFRLCQPTVMDKYATTKISVYLVIDPMPVDDTTGKERDETEEGMQVVHGVTVAELRELLACGGMTIVAGWATQMALSKLRELGEI